MRYDTGELTTISPDTLYVGGGSLSFKKCAQGIPRRKVSKGDEQNTSTSEGEANDDMRKEANDDRRIFSRREAHEAATFGIEVCVCVPPKVFKNKFPPFWLTIFSRAVRLKNSSA